MAGFKIATGYVEVEVRYDRGKLIKDTERALESERSGFERAGREHVGRHIGTGAGGEIGPAAARVLRKRSKAETRSMAKALFSKGAPAFAGGFIEAVSAGFANINPSILAKNPYLAALGIAAGATLALTIVSGLAATLSAALAAGFGLGIIGLGAYLLRKEPEVKTAGKRLGDTFSSVFGRAAGAMLIPFVASLNLLTDAIKRNQPLIDKLFYILAPVITPLTEGLIGFFEAMGPGLEALAQVGADVLLDLAKNLPKWGKSIGDFFILIRDNWPQIKKSLDEFFHDLGTALGALSRAFIWLAANYGKLKAILKGVVMPPGLRIMIAVLHHDWKGDWNRLTAWLSGIGRSIESFFTGLPGRAYRGVAPLWQRIRSAFTGAGLGMRINVSGMVGWVVRFLATLPGKAARALASMRGRVTGVFSGASGWLRSAGWNIISGLVSGISNAANSILRSTLSWVTSMIPDWKGPPKRDEGLLRPAAKKIMFGFNDEIKRQSAGTKRTMTGVTVGIPRAVETAARQNYMTSSTSYGGHTINVTVPPTTDQKVARATAIAIRDALDALDRSRRV